MGAFSPSPKNKILDQCLNEKLLEKLQLHPVLLSIIKWPVTSKQSGKWTWTHLIEFTYLQRFLWWLWKNAGTCQLSPIQLSRPPRNISGALPGTSSGGASPRDYQGLEVRPGEAICLWHLRSRACRHNLAGPPNVILKISSWTEDALVSQICSLYYAAVSEELSLKVWAKNIEETVHLLPAPPNPFVS